MASRLTAGERMLREVTEAQWQSTVISIARLAGWMVYWPPANKPTAKGHVQSITAGWPDLAFVRGKDFFVAELKREVGKTTPEQDQWLAALAAAGVETHVWRPSDQFEVTERLRRNR